MLFSEILDLKSGTLIKGLSITSDCYVKLNPSGWNDDFVYKLNKNDLSDYNNKSYNIVYCNNKSIGKLIENNKIHICSRFNLKYSILKQNSKNHIDIKANLREKTIRPGECLGMSLGKTFALTYPNTDMYRKDYYKLYVFHNVLFDDTFCWICMYTNVAYKKLLLAESRSELYNKTVFLL